VVEHHINKEMCTVSVSVFIILSNPCIYILSCVKWL
jgi:hypothetical protein